jgi:hypothetical protein
MFGPTACSDVARSESLVALRAYEVEAGEIVALAEGEHAVGFFDGEELLRDDLVAVLQSVSVESSTITWCGRVGVLTLHLKQFRWNTLPMALTNWPWTT